MNHDRTYRPVPHAPAPRLRDANCSMRQAPRRSAGHAATHPVQPLKGLPGTRATDVSYRALAPGGAGFCYRICTGTSEARPTAHYSLLTANSTYTFSAKERDSETGLSYFGSRYYSSDLSVWLSVDPMSDKYPSLSPYTYCADNPVKLVDPNGEEVCDGGDPSSKRLRRFYDYFDKKIRAPLMKMVEDGANNDDLEAAADYLCNKYQKRLLRGYNRAVNGMGRIEKINVEVFSETEEKIEIDSRPDNQEMTVCGEIPIGANVYAVEIDFNPYGVENYATFTAANKVETGWINSPEGNSFSYDLEVDGAGSITYCIQNRLADKRHDNWSFSVTMRSRRLDIRPELRISNCRSRKKIVRKR